MVCKKLSGGRPAGRMRCVKGSDARATTDRGSDRSRGCQLTVFEADFERSRRLASCKPLRRLRRGDCSGGSAGPVRGFGAADRAARSRERELEAGERALAGRRLDRELPAELAGELRALVEPDPEAGALARLERVQEALAGE